MLLQPFHLCVSGNRASMHHGQGRELMDFEEVVGRERESGRVRQRDTHQFNGFKSHMPIRAPPRVAMLSDVLIESRPGSTTNLMVHITSKKKLRFTKIFRKVIHRVTTALLV